MGLARLPSGLVRALPTVARKVAPRLDPTSRSWLAGERGEQLVAAEVERVIRDLGGELVCDVKVGDENIDLVAVLPTGLFVIEVKHWSGRVTLRNDVMFRGSRTPHRLHAQVERQQRKLLTMLERELEVHGVIVFVPNGHLELRGAAAPGTTPVMLVEELASFLTFRDGTPRGVMLSPVDVAGLAARVRYGRPMRIRLLDEPAQTDEPANDAVRCVRCSSDMVLRHGPHGPFLGCTAFPKCRSTQPV